MNRWGISDWLEKEVKIRDKTCIYCGIRLQLGNITPGFDNWPWHRIALCFR